MENPLLFTPFVGLLGLLCSLALFVIVGRSSPGNERMQEISALIQAGAMAFLHREYRILAAFVVLVAGLLAWQLNTQTALCFVSGAIFSVLAGLIGLVFQVAWWK